MENQSRTFQEKFAVGLIAKLFGGELENIQNKVVHQGTMGSPPINPTQVFSSSIGKQESREQEEFLRRVNQEAEARVPLPAQSPIMSPPKEAEIQIDPKTGMFLPTKVESPGDENFGIIDLVKNTKKSKSGDDKKNKDEYLMFVKSIDRTLKRIAQSLENKNVVPKD